MRIKFKHVLVLFGTRYNHLFHRGIAAYARQTSWHLSVWVHPESKPLPAMGSIDGVLVADDLPEEVLHPVVDDGVACISLLARADGLGLPQVAGDNLGIGRLAGEHFSERGFRNYAFFGPTDSLWARLRRDGFREAVAKSAASFTEIGTVTRAPSDWGEEKRSLEAKLAALPRPCGLFSASDPLACRVLDVCLELGLKIPEEIAILGVDNDPLYCESVAVPLSSVRHDVDSVGFGAAQQLERLMAGESIAAIELIAPLGIAVRRSTDHYATEHPVVLAALRFINEHYARNIGVEDVAKSTKRPLRTLQYLFQMELGESVVERITRMRLTKAQEWLERSSISVAEVAARTGFSSSGYFHRVFKARFGCTPVQFAKRIRKI